MLFEHWCAVYRSAPVSFTVITGLCRRTLQPCTFIGRARSGPDKCTRISSYYTHSYNSVVIIIILETFPTNCVVYSLDIVGIFLIFIGRITYTILYMSTKQFSKNTVKGSTLSNTSNIEYIWILKIDNIVIFLIGGTFSLVVRQCGQINLEKINIWRFDKTFHWTSNTRC